MRPNIHPSARVDEARLWDRHEQMAAIGGFVNEQGHRGVNRAAFSAEDIGARRLLIGWAKARGWAISSDPIGNIFVRRPGRDPDAAPVLTGSHMDSQPRGGRFDGIYGVLAGLEALEAMDDAGVETERPIDLVAWSNEEGGRYQPGTMGSNTFVGGYDFEKMLATRDGDGIELREALAETMSAMKDFAGDLQDRPFNFPIAACVEAHIEQGPRLEADNRTIGVVTGIQGIRWYLTKVFGRTDHAGTTPLRQRKDAVQATLRVIQGFNELMHDPDDVLRFTVARMFVRPNAPSSVANEVEFTVDFRHPDIAVLKERGDKLPGLAAELAAPCTVEMNEMMNMAPTVFPDELINTVEAATRNLGHPYMHLPSGAFHDAGYIAKVAPTTMIFIPCKRGVSHNEAEDATPADCAAGAQVLADTLVALANR
ncbi:M20 family metallo-hydrolase [Marinibaculum pumilum]|uniref:M20 family metallo-hydrolase n=1 Tax=Marinibaculum pumilum TaxID=1766165 RepID=A0ABV7L0M1_9PROT